MDKTYYTYVINKDDSIKTYYLWKVTTNTLIDSPNWLFVDTNENGHNIYLYRGNKNIDIAEYYDLSVYYDLGVKLKCDKLLVL